MAALILFEENISFGSDTIGLVFGNQSLILVNFETHEHGVSIVLDLDHEDAHFRRAFVAVVCRVAEEGFL